MATSKSNKSSKGSGSVAWGNSVRPSVDVGSGVSHKDESDIPTIIVICIAIMALVLVLVIPAMAIIYVDMNNATNAAIVEIRKMRELRAKLLIETQGE
jgi:hypothetical protein